MKKISITDNFSLDDFHLDDGDTIRPPHINFITHQCCDCGLKHKWFIKAKKNRVIILRPYRVEE